MVHIKGLLQGTHKKGLIITGERGIYERITTGERGEGTSSISFCELCPMTRFSAKLNDKVSIQAQKARIE